ncbi:MAG: hypothetical protein EXR45_05145 [Chloroflexi bacterium]|nr:hypothetical protein [Chloroflexota bacterium]
MRSVGESGSVRGGGGPTGSSQEIEALVHRVAVALEEDEFDPARAGEVFLAADAERAIGDAFSPTDAITVSRDGRWAVPGFLGLRVSPDLVVTRGVAAPPPDGGETSTAEDSQTDGVDEVWTGPVRIAVTITVLKQDARPVQRAIADAVLLAAAFPAVVMVILDRRLEKRDPFGADAPQAKGLSVSDRRLVGVLRRRHGIAVVIRRQDPFGWG